jgi:hypothetical protein
MGLKYKFIKGKSDDQHEEVLGILKGSGISMSWDEIVEVMQDNYPSGSIIPIKLTGSYNLPVTNPGYISYALHIMESKDVIEAMVED